MPAPIIPIKLTVEEKICLHLLDYIQLRDEFVLPEEISQNGIAEAIGVQRGHASVALISLKKKELVTEKVSRVSDSSRRIKVYFLTRTGLDETLKAKKMFEETSVVVSVGGKEQNTLIKEINSIAERKISLVKILDALSESAGTLVIESLVRSSTLPQEKDTKFREGEIPPPPEDMAAHPERWKTPPPPVIQVPPPPPQPPSEPPSRVLSGASKVSCTLVGIVLSLFCLAFLALYIDHGDNIYLVSSLLFLFFALLLLQCPVALELHSSGSGELRLERKEMLSLAFSLALLSIFARSLQEEELFAHEIARASMVVLPLLLVLNVKEVVPEHLKLEIAGIVGSLFALYGLIQEGFSVFTGAMHYPFLWIISGVIIIVTVYSSRSEGGGHEKKLKEAKLLISACTGSGIFILMALLSSYQRMSDEPLSAVLLVLWLLFALVLCSLRWWKSIEQDMKDLLISSFFVVVGFLFFFAAGIFFSLEKHIEGVVELLVGLVILRFSLNYLKLAKEHLLFTALFVGLGMLSVYDFYVNI